MKKFLLASTALMMGAAVFADDVNAGAPEVTIGGMMNFQIGMTDQDDIHSGPDSATRPFDQSVLFFNEVDVLVKVNGRADNGLGYGGVVHMESELARATSATDGYSVRDAMALSMAFMYVDSEWGRLEMGSMYDAAYNMAVNGGTVARGNGGISGNWYDFVNVENSINAAATDYTNFLYKPYLPSKHDVKTEAANKVAYYSPRLWGLQLGLSYTPDNSNTGSRDNAYTADKTTAIQDARFYENIVSIGASYTNQFNQVGVALSATGEVGHAEKESGATQPSEMKNLKAYEVGATLSYMGFTVGASYINWNKSMLLDAAAIIAAAEELHKGSSAFTAGASYEYGPMGFSISYMKSERHRHKFSNLMASADYKLASGIMPYVEFGSFDLDALNTTPAMNNSGSLVMFGTKLDF